MSDIWLLLPTHSPPFSTQRFVPVETASVISVSWFLAGLGTGGTGRAEGWVEEGEKGWCIWSLHQRSWLLLGGPLGTAT